MKRGTPWTLDEKLMVFGPTLFVLGLGAFSWQEWRAQVIDLPVTGNHTNAIDGIYLEAALQWLSSTARSCAPPRR